MAAGHSVDPAQWRGLLDAGLAGWRVDSLVSSRCAPWRRRSVVIGMSSCPVAPNRRWRAR